VSLRTPPRLATWLLKHFGPGYRHESLSGDLLEEYQRNRTRSWYWRQTAAAVMLGLRTQFPQFTVKVLLRMLIELGIVVGGAALAESSVPPHRVEHLP